MGRNMIARRILMLVCLFLAAAPLELASGQETLQEGLQEGGVDVDDLADATRLSEGGDASDSAFEDAADALSDDDGDDDSAEAAEDSTDHSAGGGGDGGDGGGGGGSVSGFWGMKSTKKKTGNKMCGWSWKERRCEPVALCQYKYQFLDATVSESCRLKDFSVVRKVFETSDVEVKPAVALAGAATLFSADLAAIRYTSWLERFPLLFNVVQGFVLFVSGDALFQVIEQGWKKVVGLRFWRMTRSGLIGALNNGLVHYSYYKWIDKRFPYGIFTEKRWGPADGARSKLAVGFTKWAIEWPTVGIYKIASMYILTAALSGSMEGLWQRMKDSFFLTWLRSLQVWPIYDMILYAYVPTAHRPLFNSFMSIAWGGYLSHVSQPHDAGAEEEEEEKEAGE